MDYQKHYEKLISRAKQRINPAITERHHIVPRSIGGVDSSENIVLLTPEEHFVGHQLLVKIYPNWSFQLTYALNMMTVNSPRLTRSNKRYGWIRRKYIAECKTRVGSKNPSFGRRWYYDPDTLANGKFPEGEQPNEWILGRVPKTVRMKNGYIYSDCTICGKEVKSTVERKYCDTHKRHFQKTEWKRKKGTKTKELYTDKEKIEALKKSNGNVRAALYSLGLCDSGAHYKKMRKLKDDL